MLRKFIEVMNQPSKAERTEQNKRRRREDREIRFRKMRLANIRKNNASLAAMGLSHNVNEWPDRHKPAWVR